MKSTEVIEVLDLIDFEKLTKIQIFDGSLLFSRHSLMHDLDSYALYAVKLEKNQIKTVVDLIRNAYDSQYEVQCFYKKNTTWKREIVQVNNLHERLIDEDLIYLFFHPVDNHLSINEFVELVSHLRAPDGCPWDRKQTHRTLRTTLLEESYEVLEAIDSDDGEHLREELGDLLLQIVLHAQIAFENSEFTLSEVIFDIHKKITNRHPHVFGDVEVENIQGVMKNWEKLKDEERNHDRCEEFTSILSSIPKQLPSLAAAQKYQERAARIGFDWKEISGVFEKIEEEIEEIKQTKTKKRLESEMGDLLFAVVNLIRWNGLDAESALRMANEKFRKRFEYIEKSIAAKGKSMSDFSLTELDNLWEQAKKIEHNNEL